MSSNRASPYFSSSEHQGEVSPILEVQDKRYYVKLAAFISGRKVSSSEGGSMRALVKYWEEERHWEVFIPVHVSATVMITGSIRALMESENTPAAGEEIASRLRPLNPRWKFEVI
jgi:hypothetical protein